MVAAERENDIEALEHVLTKLGYSFSMKDLGEITKGDVLMGFAVREEDGKCSAILSDLYGYHAHGRIEGVLVTVEELGKKIAKHAASKLGEDHGIGDYYRSIQDELRAFTNAQAQPA